MDFSIILSFSLRFDLRDKTIKDVPDGYDEEKPGRPAIKFSRYDTDQAISLELSAMALDVAAKLLKPGGSFVTKAFQGTGIELLIEACKKRFSFVRRFSPTASRNASSEVYVVCKNKKHSTERLDSAIEYIQQGLIDAGVLVGDEEEDEESVVGFRRL